MENCNSICHNSVYFNDPRRMIQQMNQTFRGRSCGQRIIIQTVPSIPRRRRRLQPLITVKSSAYQHFHLINKL